MSRLDRALAALDRKVSILGDVYGRMADSLNTAGKLLGSWLVSTVTLAVAAVEVLALAAFAVLVTVIMVSVRLMAHVTRAINGARHGTGSGND